MLSLLRCNNYRSLESVEIHFAALTAIVGPNGAGKTSVLRALNLILGNIWPSMRSVRIPQDFCRFDTHKGIEIEVHLDPRLVHVDRKKDSHEVAGFRFKCTPYVKSGRWGDAGDLHDSFEPFGPDGDVPNVVLNWPRGQRPQFGPLRVGTGMRDEAAVLFIDDRRSLSQHSPTTRGSALSRLFLEPRKQFEADPESKASFVESYEQALAQIKTKKLLEIEETIAGTAKRMLGFLGSRAVRDIEIGFGFADPANPFNSLRLEFREGGLVIPAEELGLGIQSSMVVGIFEALRKIGGRGATVIIEEPEMYLHPQAQRYFYGLLCDLADKGDCQVVYSTHSPVFADVGRFESIRLLRKEVGEMTSVAWVQDAAHSAFLSSQRDSQKMESLDASRSEVLFARRALLVEGVGDRLAAQLVAEGLGHDIDAEDLAVVACGAKSALPFFIRLCQALAIPFVVLHDEDVYPEDEFEDVAKARRENTAARAANEELSLLIADPHRHFVTKPTLEAELGIGRNAKDKPKRIVQAISSRGIDECPDALIAAVQRLLEEVI